MSAFAWLDYSEQQRRRMLEIVGAFRDQETVDELGIGSVRDALADTLFPGTSTLHTRIRYLLFIPWIYLDLEREKTSSSDVARRLKQRELRLIEALEAGGEYRGVIGIEARKRLQRFPSIVYWNGLSVFGIRLFAGSQQQYHQALGAVYTQRGRASRYEGDEPGGEEPVRTWHPRIPRAPQGFLDEATFALRRGDAEYLQERILERTPDSCLAYLVTREGATIEGDFPWTSPLLAEAPATVAEALAHARNASELLHGAALLYNLLLSEQVNDARRVDDADLAVDDDLTAHYRDLLSAWAALVTEHVAAYETWNRPAFWQLVAARNPRLSARARAFIDHWIDLAVRRRGDIADDAEARDLLRNREIAVKRRLARVTNLRALERWNGASGVAPLSFRWREGAQFAADVLDGLEAG